MPRRKGRVPNGDGQGGSVGGEAGERPKPPTSDDLGDNQRAVTFTHEAVAVREALLKHDVARNRILVLILHEKVRSEALSVRHEANDTTLHASSDGFVSEAFGRLRDKRSKLDPFDKAYDVADRGGYETLVKLPGPKLDSLIGLLVVEHVTAHMRRPTELVRLQAAELKVNLRDHWRADAAWLSGYRKTQLAHLIVELKGAVHAPGPEAKKTALVEQLAKLFADAAASTLDNKEIAARANGWMPANLRTAEKPVTSPQRCKDPKGS